MTAWTRHFTDWEDKRAVCRHVWKQAECACRLRERLIEFPGTNAKTCPSRSFKPLMYKRPALEVLAC